MADGLALPLPIADEKARISIIHPETSNSSQTTLDFDASLEKRVIRKCDWRVVPPTIIIFALSFIDRWALSS